MNDQCKHCTVKGDIKACKATECSIHESWYAAEQQKKIITLERLVEHLNEQAEILKGDVKRAGIRAAAAVSERLTSNTEHMARQDVRLAENAILAKSQEISINGYKFKIDQMMGNHVIEINRLIKVNLDLEEECDNLVDEAMGDDL